MRRLWLRLAIAGGLLMFVPSHLHNYDTDIIKFFSETTTPELPPTRPISIATINMNAEFAPDEIRPLERLMLAAHRYSSFADVPYIWGGSSAASSSACKRCRDCAVNERIPLKQRFGKCEACQECGVDCSHLVNEIFKSAGLGYPYADTNLLLFLSRLELERRLDLVDIGVDLRKTQTGDLLLYEKHIVMLTAYTGRGKGSIIHATALGDRDFLGGIRMERNAKLRTFRGKLVKILRHKAFTNGSIPTDPPVSGAFADNPTTPGNLL